MMNLKKISIEFDVADVQHVLAIALDDNADEAMVFIRENLAKKMQKAFQRH